MNIKSAIRIPPAGALLRRLTPILLLTVLANLEAGALPVSISVRARAVAPSEPVRIDVLTSEPLASLEGEFLGKSVFFVRTTDRGDSQVWSGWAMIGLDEPARLTSIEVRGRTTDGGEALGSHAVSRRMITPTVSTIGGVRGRTPSRGAGTVAVRRPTTVPIGSRHWA